LTFSNHNLTVHLTAFDHYIIFVRKTYHLLHRFWSDLILP
jgi:hypothetical protein